MSKAAGKFEYLRGTTVKFIMDQIISGGAPVFLDGTEVVTCDAKIPINGSTVPDVDAPVVFSITPVFVASVGGESARWEFIIPADVCELLDAIPYILNVKIVRPNSVVKTRAVILDILESPT